MTVASFPASAWAVSTTEITDLDVVMARATAAVRDSEWVNAATVITVVDVAMAQVPGMVNAPVPAMALARAMRPAM